MNPISFSAPQFAGKKPSDNTNEPGNHPRLFKRLAIGSAAGLALLIGGTYATAAFIAPNTAEDCPVELNDNLQALRATQMERLQQNGVTQTDFQAVSDSFDRLDTAAFDECGQSTEELTSALGDTRDTILNSYENLQPKEEEGSIWDFATEPFEKAKIALFKTDAENLFNGLQKQGDISNNLPDTTLSFEQLTKALGEDGK